MNVVENVTMSELIPLDCAVYQSPIGDLHLYATSEALVRIDFRAPPKTVSQMISRKIRNPILQNAVLQLQAYFAGKRKKFDLPLAMFGTPFQLEVWKELRSIPFGKTISYAEQARRVGAQKAFRAVGTANGRNPIPIIIPCHRVIALSGELGGYSGGLEVKSKLLSLEASIRDFAI
jgi:methylated-DNA-[protein]-cysteine S-methyltransferase